MGVYPLRDLFTNNKVIFLTPALLIYALFERMESKLGSKNFDVYYVIIHTYTNKQTVADTSLIIWAQTRHKLGTGDNIGSDGRHMGGGGHTQTIHSLTRSNN